MWIKFRVLDPTIVIGVIISLFVSVILVLIGQDGISSLIVGLLITTITLLIDAISRINEGEKRILNASLLDSAVMDDHTLLSAVSRLIGDYKLVKGLEDNFFLTKANDVLMDCRNTLHGLAEGQMTIEGDRSQFNYGERAKFSVKLVNAVHPAEWKTRYGENLIRANARAIERGVKFTHLWILNSETLFEYKKILFQLQEIGVEVRLATPDDIPSHLWQHYRLVDDKKLIRLEVGVNGKQRSQRIDIDHNAVEKAKQDFKRLCEFTLPLNRYFENIEAGPPSEAT
jgi:hypothetical protein